MTEEETNLRCIDVPVPLLRVHPTASSFIVEGNRTNNVVLDDMAAMFNPSLAPANGSVAIVETANQKAAMRRWYRGGKTLTLVTDSTGDYEDIAIKWDDGSIRVICVVM